MAPQTETRVIKINIASNDSGQLKSIANQLGNMSKYAKQSAKELGVLAMANKAYMATLSFAAFGVGIGSIVKMSDSMQLLTARMGVLGNGSETALQSMSKLTEIANKNGSSIEDTAVVYTRLAMSMKDMGIEGDRLRKFTDALQQSFRLSGASSAEMTGSVIQLSQGLASGQVRGQELRSVLESNVVIGDLLAKQLKVTRGELLRYSEKIGGIKSEDVLAAIENGMSSLDEQTEKLGLTISQTLTKSVNDLSVAWNEINDKFKISEGINSLINTMTKNLIPAIELLLVYLGGRYLLKILPLVISGFNTLKIAIFTLGGIAATATAYVVGLKVAFMSLLTPINLVVAGISAAYLAFSYWTDIVKLFQLGWLKTKLALEEFNQAFSWPAKKGSDVYNERLQTLKGIKDEIDAINGKVKQSQVLGPDGDKYTDDLIKYAKTKKEAAPDTFANLNATRLSLGTSFDTEYKKRFQELQLSNLKKEFLSETSKMSNAEYEKQMNEIKYGKQAKEKVKSFVQTTRGELSALNEAYLKTGDSAAYALGLRGFKEDTAKRSFAEGRTDLEAYRKVLSEVNIEQIKADKSKSIYEQDRGINAETLTQVNQQWKDGTISLREYNEQLVKLSEFDLSNLMGDGNQQLFSSSLQSGIDNYLSSIGNAASSMATMWSGAFKQMEDDIVNWVKTGKLSTAQLADYFIDQLLRMATQQLILRPILEGAAGSMGLSMPAASPVVPHAKGGVVDSPTFFSYGNNKKGVAGESGTEAILPLGRNAQGQLGVNASIAPVNVTVINNGSSQVETSESTSTDGSKSIEIIIQDAVKSGLSKGSFDRQFTQAYGIRRVGA